MDELTMTGTITRIFTFQGGTGAEFEVHAEGAKYPMRLTTFDAPNGATEKDRLVCSGGSIYGKPSKYKKKDGTEVEGINLILSGASVKLESGGSAQVLIDAGFKESEEPF